MRSRGSLYRAIAPLVCVCGLLILTVRLMAGNDGEESSIDHFVMNGWGVAFFLFFLVVAGITILLRRDNPTAMIVIEFDELLLFMIVGIDPYSYLQLPIFLCVYLCVWLPQYLQAICDVLAVAVVAARCLYPVAHFDAYYSIAFVAMAVFALGASVYRILSERRNASLKVKRLEEQSHELGEQRDKAVTRSRMALVAAGAVVLPVLLAYASGLNSDSHAAMRIATRDRGFEAAGFGQPLIILLASLIVSSEYANGQIRTSLAATPKRTRLLTAKTIVTAVLSTLIGLVATPIAVLLEQWTMANSAGSGFVPVFTREMQGNVLTVALNYILIALIAQSLTVITRSIIATIVVLVPMVLGFTIGLVPMFPILRFLPDLAGIQLLTRYPGIPLLAPLPGALVMTTWAIMMLVLSMVFFDRQDINA